jgi:hypothetical protein
MLGYPANLLVLLLVDCAGVGIAIFGENEPMPARNDTYFRHLKPAEKACKRSKLWRSSYRFRRFALNSAQPSSANQIEVPR